MARLGPATPRSRPDPTIALINIVFLMLIFFLIAGQLAPPLDPALELVDTSDLAAAPPPDALVISAEGEVSYRGDPVEPAAYLETLEEGARVRLVPDRALPASRLVEVASELRAAGAPSVAIVSRQGDE